MIERYGETVTLRRIVGTGLFETATVKAFFGSGPAVDEAPGGVRQFPLTVRVGADAFGASGWPVPPRRGDQIVVRGTTTTVQAVDIHRVGETASMYVMTLDGS